MRTDYLLHTLAGLGIAEFMYDFGVLPAIIAVTIAALLKDVMWDKLLKKGTFEWNDIFCTLGGGTVGIFAELLKNEFIIKMI